MAYGAFCGRMEVETNYSLNTFSRYASIGIGQPPQQTEMDLNMLASDFYVVTTTSRKGSKFDDFFSQSYGTVFQLCCDLPDLLTS